MNVDQNDSLSWEEFLSPELLRTKLISTSLFLTVFQMLKECIIERIKDFYTHGVDETGWLVDPRYEAEVLSRDKSRVYASLRWLLDRGAIDQADLGEFERLKLCRNKLAHDLASVSLGTATEHLTLFPAMVELLSKIERWWIVNVEIPTNEEFDGVEIDEAGIVPGRLMTVKILADLALGSDKEAKAYLDYFKEHHGVNPSK